MIVVINHKDRICHQAISHSSERFVYCRIDGVQDSQDNVSPYAVSYETKYVDYYYSILSKNPSSLASLNEKISSSSILGDII